MAFVKTPIVRESLTESARIWLDGPRTEPVDRVRAAVDAALGITRSKPDLCGTPISTRSGMLQLHTYERLLDAEQPVPAWSTGTGKTTALIRAVKRTKADITSKPVTRSEIVKTQLLTTAALQLLGPGTIGPITLWAGNVTMFSPDAFVQGSISVEAKHVSPVVDGGHRPNKLSWLHELAHFAAWGLGSLLERYRMADAVGDLHVLYAEAPVLFSADDEVEPGKPHRVITMGPIAPNAPPRTSTSDPLEHLDVRLAA